MSQSGFVVWFTGLSGSGKSTLAAMLAAEIARRGRARRDARRRRGAHPPLQGARLLARKTATPTSAASASSPSSSRGPASCAITAAISPYREIRDEQRRAAGGRFCEVYCSCPIDALSARDAKGLYKKALAGEIKHFTGVDDPYEAPQNADVVVHTDKESKEESLAKILAKLEELGYVRAAREAGQAREPASGSFVPHGGELVDRWVARHRERIASPRRRKSLPAITLDERGAADVECIATGAFSPLKGFMGSEGLPARRARDASRERPRLVGAHHARRLPGGRPNRSASGSEVALRMADGRIVAVLEVSDKFVPDKETRGARGVPHDRRQAPRGGVSEELGRGVHRRRDSRAGAPARARVPGLPSRSRGDTRALPVPRMDHGGRLPDAQPHAPRARVHHQVRARDRRRPHDPPARRADQERRHLRRRCG